jgi:hypothetical protein
MNTVINFAPLITEVVKVVIIILAILLTVELKKLSFVKRNAALSDNFSKLVWDAAHYAMAQEPAALQRYVGSTSVHCDDALVGTAANWLLKAATSEIAGLNLSPDDVIAAVSAILPQAKAALTPSLPAPTKE